MRTFEPKTCIPLLLLIPACSAGELRLASDPGLIDDPGGSVANIATEILFEDDGPDWDWDRAPASHTTSDEVWSAGAETTAAPAGAPNIVVIIADDLPRRLLGFDGNARIHTPNLDALKRSGVTFDRFYLPIGQCGPSRSVLWTGLHPTANGVQTNNMPFTNRYTPVFPKALKDNGYRTGFFGKCHIGTFAPADLQGLFRFDAILHTRGASKVYPSDHPYKDIDLWDPKVYKRVNVSAPKPGVHYTELVTQKAIEFIETEHRAGRRFFVWLAHRAPHPQTTKSTDANGGWSNGPPGQRYTLDDVPGMLNPATAGDKLANKPPQQHNSPSKFFRQRLGRHPLGFKEHVRRIFEQTRFMDEQIGKLMNKLQALGAINDTLVVFLSDNGAFVGNRGLAGKGPFNYDDITRVPLVMSWPGHLPGGETRKALIQSTDLSATLLAAAKLGKLPGSRSSSFWPVARGDKPDKHRQAVFFQYHSQSAVISRVRGVLKNDYKLSHYLGSRYFAFVPDDSYKETAVPLIYHSPATFELYNLRSDPNELTNLMPYRDKTPGTLISQLRDDPARRRVLNDLLRTMTEQQSAANDDMGLRLQNVSVRRLTAQKAVIRWQSVSVGSGKPAAGSSEVVFRQKSCGSCTVFEYDFKAYETDHEVTLAGLDPGKEYEALVYSISSMANGGFARYIIPATAGQYGKPGAGSPRLTYSWNSYQTTVKSASGPPPETRARCLIETRGGYDLADYPTERKVCVDDCRLRQATSPHRRCSWNGGEFQPSQ